DHAYRLTHGVGQGIGARRNDLSCDLVAPARVVAHRIDDRGHVLAPNRRERLAGIQTFNLNQLILVLLQQGSGSLQDAAPFGSTQRAPDFERSSGPPAGLVDARLAPCATSAMGSSVAGSRSMLYSPVDGAT